MIKQEKKEKKIKKDIEDIDERMVEMREKEEGIRDQISERRGVMEEVMEELKRMGINKKNEIIVRKEDEIEQVRREVIMGEVVKDMRDKVKEMKGDMKDMKNVREYIEKEKEKMKEKRKEKDEERESK